MIEGYEAPIHQSLTTRITTWGIPRLWFIILIAGSLFLSFVIWSVFRSWLACGPIALGFAGHLGLKALTWWDHDWDAVLVHSVRYRSHYEAG